MNLKEAFRYQKFLADLMGTATREIINEENCLKTVKTHHCNKVNPDDEDYTEEVTNGRTVTYDPNVLVALMQSLILERESLTHAISEAKEYSQIDLDSAIETNKFRQEAYEMIKRMLKKCRASKNVEHGQGYKFNVDGNQVPYFYDIDVETTEVFDRDKIREAMRNIISEADTISNEIDYMMINTNVMYAVPYDVNDSFEDVVAAFEATVA